MKGSQNAEFRSGVNITISVATTNPRVSSDSREKTFDLVRHEKVVCDNPVLVGFCIVFYLVASIRTRQKTPE